MAAVYWYTKSVSTPVERPVLPNPMTELTAKPSIKVLLGLVMACVALAFVPSPAHANSLTSCPTFTNQVNDSVARYDAICGLSCPAWVEVGGLACEPPDLVGLITSGFSLDPLGQCADDPATCGDKLNDIMDKTGDDDEDNPSGDGGDKFKDILKDPNFKDIVDPEKTPLVLPPTDNDGDTTTTVEDPTDPDNPIVINYKKVCKLWTNDDAYIDDPNNPGTPIVNPNLPVDLQDIVNAGGYITPTQVCLVIRADDTATLAAVRHIKAKSLVSPFWRSSRRMAAGDTSVKFNLRFKNIVHVAGADGQAKKRMTCAYNPFVVLSSVLVKDPGNPSRQLTAGQASGRICRAVVFHEQKIPALTPKEKLLVRKGYGVIVFKIVGLPSKGSRERPVPLPYGRIKILSNLVKTMNGNSGGFVLTNKYGIAKWIGTIPKTGIYRVSGAWPFYKNQISNFELKTTIKSKKKKK